MNCLFCGWSRAHECHDISCPERASSEDKKQVLADNQRGYRDGRYGLDLSDKENMAYRLGWCRGVVALEEYENGHDPRFY